MRIELAVLFLFIFLSALTQDAASAKSEWFRFTLSKNLDPGSPADRTKILDAPAGKHGFLKVKSEMFVFEDGSPARFWGTNFGSHVSFPSKEEAESLARRISFLGFNIVRLHHLDFYDEPGGIFKSGTSELSPAQLERLDYLVYQLKKYGIYVNMNLLTMRRFRSGEGVAEAEKIQPGGKPVAFFDPKLIELQKKYAKDLLGHKNPYTGLRYAEEPAVAFVELTNENSLFDFWKWDNLNGYLGGLKKGSIPPYYVAELDQLWNQQLKEKYGRDSNSKRPLFATLGILTAAQRSDIENFYIDLQKRFFTEMTRYLRQELGVRAPITGIGGYCHRNDLKSLEVTDFIDTHSYFDHPQFSHGWNKDNFTMKKTSFFLDDAKGFAKAIEFSRVPGKPLTLSEWNHCYPNPYAYEMPLFIAAEAVSNRWPAVYQFAWSLGALFEPHAGNIDSFFHISQNAQQMLLCLAAGAVFQESEGLKSELRDGVFTLDSKNAKCAAGFIQNKALNLGGVVIRSKENGAVALFSADQKPISESGSLILMTVGEIKNRDSRWDGGGFYWGGPWSLLKKIPVEISLKADKPCKVYALKEDGSRGAELKTELKEGILSFSTELVSSPWYEISPAIFTASG